MIAQWFKYPGLVSRNFYGCYVGLNMNSFDGTGGAHIVSTAYYTKYTIYQITPTSYRGYFVVWLGVFEF